MLREAADGRIAAIAARPAGTALIPTAGPAGPARSGSGDAGGTDGRLPAGIRLSSTYLGPRSPFRPIVLASRCSGLFSAQYADQFPGVALLC